MNFPSLERAPLLEQMNIFLQSSLSVMALAGKTACPCPCTVLRSCVALSGPLICLFETIARSSGPTGLFCFLICLLWLFSYALADRRDEREPVQSLVTSRIH